MSESSDTIENGIVRLLQKVPIYKVLLTFGYIHQNVILDIPDEIVNYCVVYAFLMTNEWYKGGKYWKIDANKRIATRKGVNGYSTMYANPAVSQGQHEWKIKLIPDESTTHDAYIGIASKMHCLNTHFFGMYISYISYM